MRRSWKTGECTVLCVITAMSHEDTAVTATHAISTGVLFGVKSQPVVASTP